MEQSVLIGSDNKKSIIGVLICYLVWGFQPLYFSIEADTDAMFLLMSRILWGCILVTGALLIMGRGHEIIDTFKNKDLMLKHLLPAALFNFADWGIYMWAVMNGHILDTSLGYYICPLVVCFMGFLLFKEKLTLESIVATLLVVLGIIVSGSGFGNAPWVTLSLMFCFAFYAAFMKGVTKDSVLCTSVQLLVTSPIAIGFILFCRMGSNGIASVTISSQFFLMGAGIVTVLPILLYASSVKKLPMTLMGFMQYLSPTFGILCGYLLNESLSHEQLISYIFIWSGVIIYSVASAFRSKKAKAVLE